MYLKLFFINWYAINICTSKENVELRNFFREVPWLHAKISMKTTITECKQTADLQNCSSQLFVLLLCSAHLTGHVNKQLTFFRIHPITRLPLFICQTLHHGLQNRSSDLLRRGVGKGQGKAQIAQRHVWENDCSWPIRSYGRGETTKRSHKT